METINLEKELKSINIESENYEQKILSQAISKAKELQLDKMFLFFYKNKDIIKKMNIKLDRMQYNAGKKHWISSNSFNEELLYTVTDNVYFCWFKFEIKDYTVNNIKNPLIIYSTISKNYDKIAIFEDGTKLIYFSFDKFQEWGKYLLKMYYYCSSLIDEYYAKKMTQIDQASLFELDSREMNSP